ncbi:MAG: glycerophosphodiester phosphodiesterase [Acidimicrobiia bacterium]
MAEIPPPAVDSHVTIPPRLRVSAHRHGNEPTMIPQAMAAGVDMIEVDVHLFWSRLEVRHAKALGPLPLMFDRGEPWRWRPALPELHEVVTAIGPSGVLHIDLKGWRPRLAHRVAATAKAQDRYVVSARCWWLLRPFHSLEHVQTMHSIGSPRQLRWFHRRHRDRVVDAVGINADMADEATVSALRRRAGTVYSWNVTSVEQALALHAIGVDVVIVDSLEIAAAITGS